MTDFERGYQEALKDAEAACIAQQSTVTIAGANSEGVSTYFSGHTVGCQDCQKAIHAMRMKSEESEG